MGISPLITLRRGRAVRPCVYFTSPMVKLEGFWMFGFFAPS